MLTKSCTLSPTVDVLDLLCFCRTLSFFLDFVTSAVTASRFARNLSKALWAKSCSVNAFFFFVAFSVFTAAFDFFVFDAFAFELGSFIDTGIDEFDCSSMMLKLRRSARVFNAFCGEGVPKSSITTSPPSGCSCPSSSSVAASDSSSSFKNFCSNSVSSYLLGVRVNVAVSPSSSSSSSSSSSDVTSGVGFDSFSRSIFSFILR
mmetsp:Transcript_26254/g.42918  ORF Transcript_26254/g.42918 Transcript_26254/m.42918 type:complete len:204 (+) Transcript_26254:348-959(+)